MSNLLVLGHRGAAQLPENTIPSFEKALELGAHGFELDVRQTADEKLIVIHSPVVDTLAVQSNSYEQIHTLPNGFEIPLLEEVLAKFSEKAFLDIELKVPGFEQAFVHSIRKYCDPTRVLVSAFHPEILTKVHELYPEIELAFIYNRTQDEKSRHNCPIDVVKPQFRLTSRELIKEIHDEGLRVIPWTVNEEAEIRRLVNLNVDGLIGDYPEKICGVISSL